jgi:protein arginine kinase
MQLSEIYKKVGPWLDGNGPQSDIVISSRIRLARNIVGFYFLSQSTPEQQAELLHFVHNKMMASELKDKIWFLKMEEISPLERQMLTERHLISKQLAQEDGACGVALMQDESLALMINEEDHLRIQALTSGLRLHEIYDRINQIDDLLEGQMEYAFSPQYGYLTACPTNVGTGIRVSVMLHLPALKMTGQIEKVFRAAKDMHLAVRGFYGEGSEPIGDLYQISNQTTLGRTEKNIIEDLIRKAVEPVIDYEQRARKKILSERMTALDDKIFRALGVLTHARLISSEETMYMLSYLRLGVHLERIKSISMESINRIFFLTQPAHLQHQCQKKLDAVERDEARADFIRKELHLSN